jgi:CheY-like chemotaxis protein
MINILVVDDSAVDRFVIQGLLSVHQQFEIDTAGDGAVALEKIRNRVPDLVLTDMQMPNMDGLQLVEAIRSRYPAVPVILVTGEGSEDLAWPCNVELRATYLKYTAKNCCTVRSSMSWNLDVQKHVSND